MRNLILFFIACFMLLSCGGSDDAISLEENQSDLDTMAVVDSIPQYDFEDCPKAWNLEEAMAAPDSFCMLALLGHQMDKPLTEIPEDLAQMPYLRSLDLSLNRITHIPSFLEKLEEISLYGNLMSKCPSGIENIPNIVSLDLSNNKITELDSKIFNLKNLEELYLSDNNLESLPSELFELTKLRKFSFSGNQFYGCPNGIEKLINLEQLYLSEMEIDEDSFPPNMGNLRKLKSLYIGAVYANAYSGQGNSLTEIPNWIFGLDSLETLDLSYGMIELVSPEIGNLKSLTSLNLEGNQLTELPEEIRELKNLTSLLIGGNSFTDEEIEKISSWFDEDFYLELEEMNVGC